MSRCYHLLGVWALPCPGGGGGAKPGHGQGRSARPGTPDWDQGRAPFLAMAWPGAAAARPWQRPVTGNAE